MTSTEKGLVEELKCDELCVLESRKNSSSKELRKAVKDKREETNCTCSII
ncbi:MAG: hypothetical protein JW716_04440 [Candidatus Aenigmarchaeota archaeon]|nr:hypothetical protein [Candidatus Aenigmarchaeota archaeon]